MLSTSAKAAARQQKIRFAVAAFIAATPPITLALAVSIVIHSVALSIHFHLPEALLRNTENALDVVLVNSKHAHKPKHAQVYAQTNLDGGGESEQNQRAATPLPPSLSTREGNDIIETQRRVARLEAEQKHIMTRLKAEALQRTAQKQEKPLPPQPESVPLSGLDVASRAMAIARLEAQIDRQTNAYNNRPRKKFVGLRAESSVDAQYLDDWRQKVERIGALNYPDAAKGRIYGSVTIYVELRNNGDLERLEIQKPSGSKILDEAALKIVRSGAPYGNFPPELKTQTDILSFARALKFTREDQLQTQ